MGVTFSSIITNIVPSSTDVFAAGSAEAVASALCDLNACNPLLINGVLGGNAAPSLGDDHGAVGEGLRTAFGPEIVFAHSPMQQLLDPVYFEGLQRAGKSVYPYFPSSYVNEWTRQGEFNDIRDWQNRFWGNATYERLLRVKQKYDPCNILGVDRSVGDNELVLASCLHF